VIENVLPSNVVTIETRERVLAIELFPAEARCLGDAVESRRSEFTTGRACARRALERLGMRPVGIGAGRRGEPLWPAGVVGSITHCRGYCACAVARSGEIASVGIDAEPHAPLPEGVLDAVSSPLERVWLPREPGDACMDRLLFSAKEAVYKAWYPLTRRSLGFEDVAVAIDPRAGSFSARLLVDGPVRQVDGRWRVEDGIVVTAAVVPHQRATMAEAA
jgi:4'-phosphopantetheinyl transferase EntD